MEGEQPGEVVAAELAAHKQAVVGMKQADVRTPEVVEEEERREAGRHRHSRSLAEAVEADRFVEVVAAADTKLSISLEKTKGTCG